MKNESFSESGQPQFYTYLCTKGPHVATCSHMQGMFATCYIRVHNKT